MPKERKQQRGLMLMEVLIAITLLSLLTLGMLFAMRVATGAMATTNRRAQAGRKATNAQRILTGEVAGFLPVMAHCGAQPLGGDGGGVPFFQGRPTVMRFVTTYSVQGGARGLPQVATLFVIPGQDGRGVRLVVNESPFHGALSTGFQCLPAPDPMLKLDIPRFPEPAAGPDSFVLADQLEAVHFFYLMRPNGEPERWVPVWPRRDLWPSAIRVEILPLPGGQQRVPPMTVTGLVRPNRFPGEQYEY